MSLLVGITGGMGSGKTLAASFFHEFGAHILDADVICRKLVEPGQPALKEISECFGKSIIDEFGNLDRKKFLSLLNKTKISMSNDETRHYLNGIYIHSTVSNKKPYLTGVATDSHRLSSSSIPVENLDNFKSFILPKKTVFQLCNLLQENEEKIFLNTSDTKIQFKIGSSKITSKIIDGKFPDYKKVVPKNNSKVFTLSFILSLLFSLYFKQRNCPNFSISLTSLRCLFYAKRILDITQKSIVVFLSTIAFMLSFCCA